LRKPNLVVRDVHKGFGTGRNRVQILHGISLEVVGGETLYLVGPSGSGKTTLLSLMGCILSPDQGSVRVLDYDVSRMSPKQLTAFRKRYLSFVFQTFNLFPNLSALDNIRLTLCMRGVAGGDATRRADELLGQVGLGHRARLRPTKLSTGECQRVAIARALANEPTLLLADEPTAALDAENGQSVLRLLKRLAHERGVTLVIVTHDNRIFPFADRILRLEDGRITHQEVRRHSSPLVAELLDPRLRDPPDSGRGSAPNRADEGPWRRPDRATFSTEQIIVSNHYASRLISQGLAAGCTVEPDPAREASALPVFETEPGPSTSTSEV